MKIAHIVLDVPLHQHFDYLAPGLCADDMGRRAHVPWGQRVLTGVIVGMAEESNVAAQALKPVREILRDVPALPSEILELALFCSTYYHHPLGQVLAGVMPQRLRRVRAPDHRVVAYRLTPAGAALDVNSLPLRAVRKRQLLALLQQGEVITRSAIFALVPTAGNVLRDLLAQGWVEASPARVPGQAQPRSAATMPYALNAQQAQAVRAISAGSGFRAWLLHGVTGSGKTEVYLQAIAEVLGRGAQALVLVPEINLTPQLEARFRERFPGASLVSLHSHLNAGERLNNWLAAAAGAAQIVLGTRLAVFAPMPALQLIVVDEEHDPSYKQQDGMRYSARDVAVFRAKQGDLPIILGSATPALETYHNALQGRYGLLQLAQRAAKDASAPVLRCIDTRRAAMTEGLSAPLISALKQRLARGEQSLLFINRRGYAPVLYCTACSWTSPCARCSSHLVVHLKQHSVRCHHCGYSAPLPKHCPSCGSADLAPLGQGTQRVEATLNTFFPDARIVRIDRDSTRRKRALAGMLQRVQEREVDILIGTQMLAKGHDFPHLTLVGVLNADGGLYSADFRASERLFAQLLQVAGRAGRGALKGEVLIQTAFPDHPLFAALGGGDYPAFAQSLLQERLAACLPPYAFQALLRAEANSLERALKFLREAALAASPGGEIKLYDPIPALMSKIAGKERAQLLIESPSRAALQKFLGLWIAQLSLQKTHSVRWSLDVDPIDI